MDVSGNTFVQEVTVAHARETAVTTGKDQRCQAARWPFDVQKRADSRSNL